MRMRLAPKAATDWRVVLWIMFHPRRAYHRYEKAAAFFEGWELQLRAHPFGRSPLTGAYAEVCTDKEARTYLLPFITDDDSFKKIVECWDKKYKGER